jgi:hypothetical protein
VNNKLTYPLAQNLKIYLILTESDEIIRTKSDILNEDDITNDLDESFWAVISSDGLVDDEDEDDDEDDDDDSDVDLDSATSVEHLNTNSPARVGSNEIHDAPLEEYYDLVSNDQLNYNERQIEFVHFRNPTITTPNPTVPEISKPVSDINYLTNVLSNLEDLDSLGYTSLEYFLSTIGSDSEVFGKTVTSNMFSRNRTRTWYQDIDNISPLYSNTRS